MYNTQMQMIFAAKTAQRNTRPVLLSPADEELSEIWLPSIQYAPPKTIRGARYVQLTPEAPRPDPSGCVIISSTWITGMFARQVRAWYNSQDNRLEWEPV